MRQAWQQAASTQHKILQEDDLPALDRSILDSLHTLYFKEVSTGYYWSHYYHQRKFDQCRLDTPTLKKVLPELAETGRCRVFRDGNLAADPLRMGNPFEASLEFTLDPESLGKRKKNLVYTPQVRVGGELRPLQDISAFFSTTPLQFTLDGALHQLPGSDLAWVIEMRRNKHRVLEGLLRLRQAACHPALVGEDAASGKLDELARTLREVVDEGHKALVFSQFIKFLALIRQRLDADGVPHEYLDGRTPARTRAQRVAAFQEPSGPPVFCISLKAGGVGLNLTAADYVFIMDPWCNPTVEAQAVDRTHRGHHWWPAKSTVNDEEPTFYGIIQVLALLCF